MTVRAALHAFVLADGAVELSAEGWTQSVLEMCSSECESSRKEGVGNGCNGSMGVTQEGAYQSPAPTGESAPSVVQGPCGAL